MVQGDAPFQVFWFVVNILLTTCFTICVKLGPDFSIPGLDFSPYNHLELEKLRIIQDTLMFDVVVATIYATGFVSICLFFLMKKFNVASALPSDQEVVTASSEKKTLALTWICHPNFDIFLIIVFFMMLILLRIPRGATPGLRANKLN